MEETDEKKRVLAKVRELVRSRGGYWKRDISDLDTARSVASGFGFDEDDRQYRGEIKPEVTVTLLRQWVDQVVSTYDTNPFAIGLHSYTRDVTNERIVLEDIQNHNDFTDIASELLRSTINEGYAYALINSEVVDNEMNYQVPKIEVLDARKVFCDDCDEPDLADCDLVVVVDVVKKKKAAKKYNMDVYEMRDGDILEDLDVVSDSDSECSVLTVYEMHEGKCHIHKVVHHDVVQSTQLNISRLPVVRFFGEAVYIDKILHFRGAYHFVADLLKTINYHASEIQYRVAQAEDANWIADKKGIAGNASDWKQGSGALVKGYSSWDGDKQIAPPIQVDKSPQIIEVANSMSTFIDLVASILGKPATEGVAGETAESILARKTAGEASTNRYLKNLKKSMKGLGRVLLQSMAVYYDVPRMTKERIIPPASNIDGIQVEVESGPLMAGQRQKNLQQLLAINRVAIEGQVSGATQKIMPVMIGAMDIPEEEKQFLMQQFAAPQIPPEVQAQMGQMEQQIKAQEQYIRSLEAQVIKEETKAQAQILTTQMNNEARLQQEVIKQQSENERLQEEILADAENQILKARADLQKVLAKDVVRDGAMMNLGNRVIRQSPVL